MVRWGCVLLAMLGGMRLESFDVEPADWEGLNNRSEHFESRTVVQDFGYDGGKTVGEIPGSIGGTITPDGRAAYYAKAIGERSLETPLTASGTLLMEPGAGNLLLGFFNSETVNEWRTPNSLAFRLNGRGETFHAHTEYATSKWRAGAGVIGRYDAAADRMHPVELPSGQVYRWTLTYDPAGADGRGMLTATLGGETSVCVLSEGHKADGATFNRFGLLNVVKSVDGEGRIWIGDLTIDGEPVDLTRDPAWEGRNNRATYLSEDVRPRFDFGYSPTRHAGGEKAGEIGGMFYRGDCRFPEKLAYYGGKLETLTLRTPLRASGRLSFHRGVSDSTTLVGFFHSKHSVEVNPSQQSGWPRDFVGFAVEGPSSVGFYMYPAYRMHGNGEKAGAMDGATVVYPNGESHEWALEYVPGGNGAEATLTLTVDGKRNTLTVEEEHVRLGAEFDRFGFVTPWIDGNGQEVYLDDLAYTVSP